MLPNLLIIGAMKGGTTSLHDYLSHHPEIVMSAHKELDFFVYERNWNRGVEWYEAQFDGERAQIIGESSPSYTQAPHFDGVAGRIAMLLPGAKLIYLVRDPISRMVSHYIHNFARGREHRDINAAFAEFEGTPYVDTSRYYMQMRRFSDHFPSSRTLILASEDLKNHRRESLQRVFQFLEVDESFWCDAYEREIGRSEDRVRLTSVGYRLASFSARGVPDLLRRRLPSFVPRPIQAYNRRTAKRIAPPELDADLRGRIAEYLRDDTNRLRVLTGQGFRSWSI